MEAEGCQGFLPPPCALGMRVCIIENDNAPGHVIEHTRFADGSERWTIQYWHNGERKTVSCERREFVVIEENP